MIAHSIALDSRETVAPEWGSTATLSSASWHPLIQEHTSPWSPKTDGRQNDESEKSTSKLIILIS